MKTNKSQHLLPIVLGMLLLASCQEKTKPGNSGPSATHIAKADKADTLTFTMLADSVTEKDSAYTCLIKYQFPTAGPDSIRTAVAQYLIEVLTHVTPNIDTGNEQETAARTFQGKTTDGKAIMAHYIKTYSEGFETWLKEIDTPVSMMYQEVNASKIWETNDVMTYTVETDHFMGGVHGGFLVYGQSFRKQDGKRIQPIDTTKVDQMQKMMYEALRRDYFNEQGMPNTDEDIAQILFDKRLPLPSKYLVMTDKGIGFIYQQYEITAYAYGLPNFVIPYDQIKPYMTTEAIELIPDKATPAP